MKNGYQYVSEAKSYKVIYKSILRDGELFEIKIPRTVLEYNYNDNFIVASQVVIDSNELIREEEKQVDEAVDIRYWIIESKKDIIHGPLLLIEYEALSEKLGVPTDLTLKN
ncbi:MAG: DUF3997 domain-containing protein [Saprospiraceae bacterium]|nr:DUF3997 domain-containing protein [Saprospiraceae bacterium]